MSFPFCVRRQLNENQSASASAILSVGKRQMGLPLPHRASWQLTQLLLALPPLSLLLFSFFLPVFPSRPLHKPFHTSPLLSLLLTSSPPHLLSYLLRSPVPCSPPLPAPLLSSPLTTPLFSSPFPPSPLLAHLLSSLLLFPSMSSPS